LRGARLSPRALAIDFSHFDAIPSRALACDSQAELRIGRTGDDPEVENKNRSALKRSTPGEKNFSAQTKRPPGNWATFPSRENSSNGG
jgi:hypothetical protein